VIVAVPVSVRIAVLGWCVFPHAFSSAVFARAILRRFGLLALWAMQPASGNSATIVCGACRPRTSRWMSLSLSDSFQRRAERSADRS
jgi:hypothetical protein